MTERRKINADLIFLRNLLASDRLHAIINETTHTGQYAVSDKALDLLEFIVAAGISAGFIFLSAYVLVGGI